MAKWRATSVRLQDVNVLDGGVSSRIERDFMRSATAMVAGVLDVEGVTLSESGLVDVR